MEFQDWAQSCRDTRLTVANSARSRPPQGLKSYVDVFLRHLRENDRRFSVTRVKGIVQRNPPLKYVIPLRRSESRWKIPWNVP